MVGISVDQHEACGARAVSKREGDSRGSACVRESFLVAARGSKLPAEVQRCRPLRFLLVAVTTARCSAIGA